MSFSWKGLRAGRAPDINSPDRSSYSRCGWRKSTARVNYFWNWGDSRTFIHPHSFEKLGNFRQSPIFTQYQKAPPKLPGVSNNIGISNGRGSTTRADIGTRVLFIARFGLIDRDVAKSRELYAGSLGIPFKEARVAI
jgi:hypothetical protein